MEKDMIFFAENGLTSTSANHIANMAKEYIQSIENELDVKFVTTSINLIGNGQQILQQGTDDTFFNRALGWFDKIIQAKSLIAWLREAIKARESLLKEVRDLNLTEWLEKEGKEIPVAPEPLHPLTEDEYLASLNIKERNRYYSLETKCAVIGKYIHPDGKFSEARKEFFNAKKNPCKVSGTGRDALIYTYTSSVTEDTMEECFFNLQKIHREAQAELNGIKFKMEKAITDDTIAKNDTNNAALTEYNNTINLLRKELNAWKVKESKRISSLKIVIPADMMDIYTTVQSYGK